MKAVIINKYGDSNVFESTLDQPIPKIASNQVLVKIHAAGINPLDWKIREGQLRFLLGSKFPLILGNDASGEIVQIGEKVNNFKVGDEVFFMLDASPKPMHTGFSKSGAYAEFCVTREDTLSLKPTTITHLEAAATPLAALTAFQAIKYKAQMKHGQKILVNGASGGVGTFAVQIAKALGGEVIATCSNDAKELVYSLGADKVIDYRKQNVVDLGEQYDVIYDVAATESFCKIRKVLTHSGVYVSNVANPLNLLSTALFPLLKKMGAGKKHTYAWVKPSGSDLKIISQLIDDKKIRVVIDRIFGFDNIPDAHRYMVAGKVRGKLVIDIGEN